MSEKNKKEINLRDLFIMKLQSLYDIEHVIIKALPKMAKNVTSSELRLGLENHLTETEEQARRIERIFEDLGEKVKKMSVDGIRGIVSDGEWLIKNIEPGPALDATILASAQHVEHYEMAGYGTAREWAKLLGYREAEDLLNLTYEEEKNADATLSDLAESRINQAVDEVAEWE